MTDQSRSRRLETLDGLRGIAALIVVVSHAASFGMLPARLGGGFGQIGVCLFFALSGFLMMRLYGTGPFNAARLRSYAIARAARVLPLFYLCLGLATLSYLLTGVSGYGFRSISDALRAAVLWRGTSVLWTIPAEIHFYALFPLLWWATARGHAVAGFAALIGVSLIAHVGDAARLWQLRPLMLPTWLHFFTAGALMGWASTLYPDPTHENGPLRPVTFFALLLLPLLPPGVRFGLGLPVYPTLYDPLMTLYPLLILWLAYRQSGLLSALAHPLFRALGTISFGIYLIHQPVGVLITRWNPEALSGGGRFVLLLALTLWLSWLSYTRFERPILDWSRRRTAAPEAKPAPVPAE